MNHSNVHCCKLKSVFNILYCLETPADFRHWLVQGASAHLRCQGAVQSWHRTHLQETKDIDIWKQNAMQAEQQLKEERVQITHLITALQQNSSMQVNNLLVHAEDRYQTVLSDETCTKHSLTLLQTQTWSCLLSCAMCICTVWLSSTLLPEAAVAYVAAY